eukprot:scaffold366620_cov31-Prasinocladus_malaysianus.AAC.1
MDKMRAEVQQGKKHLAAAKRLRKEGRMTARESQSIPRQESECLSSSGAGVGTARSTKSASAEEAELAFESFVRAVHACQNLELRGGTLPKGFSDIPVGGAPGLRSSNVIPPESHIMEDEQ